jgi:peptidoglycan/LPS O-acetylase OafA/YrhL
MSVGWRAIVLVRELFGASYTTFHAYLAFAIGMAVSIAAAAVMYALIEGPSIALARKIRLPQRESSTAIPSAAGRIGIPA